MTTSIELPIAFETSSADHPSCTRKSSEPSSQCVKRIPLPIHLVLFTVRSDDPVTQDVHVDWVAVTIREDPPGLRTAIRLPPCFQNWRQFVSERHDSVFASLSCRLLFAVDVCLANCHGRARQID